MNKDRRLTHRILDQIVTNGLPREKPVKTWSGYGQGSPRNACGESVQKAQVEYQIALGNRTFGLHLGCYALWTAEVYRQRWISTVSP